MTNRETASYSRSMSAPVEKKPARMLATATPAVDSHAAIAERAYILYLRSGRQPGRCEQNWLQAERELAQEAAPLREAKALADSPVLPEDRRVEPLPVQKKSVRKSATARSSKRVLPRFSNAWQGARRTKI